MISTNSISKLASIANISASKKASFYIKWSWESGNYDKVEISQEAKELKKLLEQSIPSDGVLISQRRPWYFRDYYEYTNRLAMDRLAMEETERLIEIARKDGFDLDFNMVYEDVKKYHSVRKEPLFSYFIDENGHIGFDGTYQSRRKINRVPYPFVVKIWSTHIFTPRSTLCHRYCE
ncbi:MAG: hypothetical protein AB1630_04540 [bacterium]